MSLSNWGAIPLDVNDWGRTAAHKYCLNCGNHYRPSATYCPYDGTFLTPTQGRLLGIGAAVPDARYKITHWMGIGTLHEVYRALDQRTGQSCIVKILRFGLGLDAKTVRRYFNEVKQNCSLEHANIASTFDNGTISEESNELPYLVMELLDGEPLAQKIKRERQLDLDWVLSMCVSVCDALEYAHNRGILHRDLKPSNIFVSPDASVKITDFGLAERQLREVEWTQPKDVTATGSVYGDPSYLDPHYAIKGKAAETSDIYSLGCIFYECLAGSQTFPGENELQILFGHLQQEPPKVSYSRPKLKKFGVDELVQKCMEKEPANRYQSARELRDALEAIKSSAQDKH